MCVWMSMHSFMPGDYRIDAMNRFLAGLLFALAAHSGWAQSWPAKPVKIIVPFAPGGTADTLGRLVAQKLGEQLKASFIVENRPGAGGSIGSELASNAAPDGYTLVVSGIASHVIAPALPNGSPGNGTQGQLVAELFKKHAGIDLQHVPYKGASGAVTDLIAGHIPAVSTTLTTAATQIRAGRARGLAISAPARLPDFPDIPTFREMGYPEIVATVWFSLSGPAKMPADIVTRLNAEVNRALDLPDVRERLKPEGIVPAKMDAREFSAFVAEELRRWAPIVKASGAKND